MTDQRHQRQYGALFLPRFCLAHPQQIAAQRFIASRTTASWPYHQGELMVGRFTVQQVRRQPLIDFDLTPFFLFRFLNHDF